MNKLTKRKSKDTQRNENENPMTPNLRYTAKTVYEGNVQKYKPTTRGKILEKNNLTLYKEEQGPKRKEVNNKDQS